MDEAAISQPDLSFYSFENGFTRSSDLATLETIPVINSYDETGWGHNGFYIGDKSSSEISLPQVLTSAYPGSPAGSDCSWSEEDDTGSTFFEIPQMLQAFVLARDQTSLTIPALNSQQRRVVHGMAHMMHLGHNSYKEDGKICRMHIFKKDNHAPTGLPKAMNAEDFMSEQMQYCDLAPLESTTSLPATLPGNRLSRGFKHRIRLPKRENGYPCRSADCFKMFHRACDRDKHEQKHANKDDHPHKCMFEACKKTFMYPKDLKRHQQVHERRAGMRDVSDGYSTDDFMSDASTYSDSPSLASSISSAQSTASLFASGPIGGEDPDLTPMPKMSSQWSYFEAQRDCSMGMEKGWSGLFHAA